MINFEVWPPSGYVTWSQSPKQSGSSCVRKSGKSLPIICFLVYHVLLPRGFRLLNILFVKIYFCGFLLHTDDPKIYQATKSAGVRRSVQMHTTYWIQHLPFENYVYHYQHSENDINRSVSDIQLNDWQ